MCLLVCAFVFLGGSFERTMCKINCLNSLWSYLHQARMLGAEPFSLNRQEGGRGWVVRSLQSSLYSQKERQSELLLLNWKHSVFKLCVGIAGQMLTTCGESQIRQSAQCKWVYVWQKLFKYISEDCIMQKTQFMKIFLQPKLCTCSHKQHRTNNTVNMSIQTGMMAALPPSVCHLVI